jgi:putative serine protease PepD
VRAGRIRRIAAAALVVGVAVAAGAAGWRAFNAQAQALAAQQEAIVQLQSQVSSLQARGANQTDWTAVAAEVEPSVFTIATDSALGSGWVVRSDAGGSELLTNFHVVEAAWDAGLVTVDVRRADRTMQGTVVRVDRGNDLAVVHVQPRLRVLKALDVRPAVGSAVMAVGSPMGLGGSVSIGVISGFRSLGGSDYVQFSAPISPGNSGGPVVDREGYVMAVATAKLVGDGAEALGFGIPVQTACAVLVACIRAPAPST